MSYVRVIKDEEFQGVAYQVIKHAAKSIDIFTYIFRISKGRDSRSLQDLTAGLISQAWAKIPVRIILHKTEAPTRLGRINEHATRALRQSGIEVRSLPGNRCQHAKLILVDDEIAIIGSHNWTPRSLNENSELSVIIRDKTVLTNVKAHFDRLWEKGIK